MRFELDDLPDDISVMHEMFRELLGKYDQNRAELAKVKARLAELLRSHYGRSSEKLDESQLKLWLEERAQPSELSTDAPAIQQPEPSPRKNSTTKPASGHGRSRLPDELPRDIECPQLEAERLVCACGRCLQKIGEDVSEQLDYKPAMFRVRRRVIEKFACPTCRNAIVTAPVPAMPIEKGLATAGLLAYVAVSKFADHLPLTRLSQIFARHGVRVASSTMGGWIAAVASLLEPIVLAMLSLVLGGHRINIDDTPIPVLDRTRKKTREAHLWVLVGADERPYTIYQYCPDKQFGPIWKLLAHFEGYLQADAAPGYDRIFISGKVIEVGCRAHSRRRFYEALDQGDANALMAIVLIQKLYQVEKSAKDLPHDERRQLRQEQAVPVLEQLNKWVDEQTGRTLPESTLGKALSYSRNHRTALDRYVDDGALEIDNNAAERALRRVAVGRANWTFAGSDEGGRWAAILYSLVATCQRHGVEPWSYMADVLERVSTHPASRIEELFPDRWNQARQQVEQAAQSPPPDMSAQLVEPEAAPESPVPTEAK